MAAVNPREMMNLGTLIRRAFFVYVLPGMFNHRAQVGYFFANCVLMGGKVENIKDCT